MKHDDYEYDDDIFEVTDLSKALRIFEASADPRDRATILIMEVASRGRLSRGKIKDLCREACELCGSVENAITAIRAGALRLEQGRLH
jgi:hypothetical protein